MNQKQPSLFLAHGSPMNAIEDNSFTQSLKKLSLNLAHEFSAPRAILAISAHWLTTGTYLTSATRPRMIYDMYGFPEPLYQVKYPAKGAPDLVTEIQALITSPKILSDEEKWGLDHGTWSVLIHLFPRAQVPVIQLSIDLSQPLQFHLELGKQLGQLRQSGVLLMGSGNIVHNLRNFSWNENETPFTWAQEFTNWFESQLKDKNYSALLNDFNKTKVGQMSVPTLDHYIPLLYILGAADKAEQPNIEFSGIQNGSIAMTSFSFKG